MKYIMHMTEEEAREFFKSIFGEDFTELKKALTYLTEKKDNEFLKMTDVTKMLQVTDRTIRNWVNKRKLKSHWIGDRQFFRMKDILDSMTTNF